MKKLLVTLTLLGTTFTTLGVGQAQELKLRVGPRVVQRNYFLGLTAYSTPRNGGFPQVLRVPALTVQWIFPNSPAQRAGLHAGDVLLSANGIRLSSNTDLQTAVQYSGGVLNLEWRDVNTQKRTTSTISLIAY